MKRAYLGDRGSQVSYTNYEGPGPELYVSDYEGDAIILSGTEITRLAEFLNNVLSKKDEAPSPPPESKRYIFEGRAYVPDGEPRPVKSGDVFLSKFSGKPIRAIGWAGQPRQILKPLTAATPAVWFPLPTPDGVA